MVNKVLFLKGHSEQINIDRFHAMHYTHFMKTKECKLFKKGLCVAAENPQPINEFYKQVGVKDGRGSRCKSCIAMIAHERRLTKGGGKLRVPKRPKSIALLEKDCSKAGSGLCVAPRNPQPIVNFRPQQGRVNGRSICMACEHAYTYKNRHKAQRRTRKWNRLHKAEVRFRRMKKLYGLDKETYIEMHINQKGKCAVCQTHESELNRPLVVDHCHNTGKVRGLLCDNCNHTVGFMRDNPGWGEKAIEFLKRFKRARNGKFVPRTPQEIKQEEAKNGFQ